jgi:hypothetical protein
MKDAHMIQLIELFSLVFVATLGSPTLPAASQTPIEQSRELHELLRQMPDCKELRNDCQVCVKLPDGKLGCSNIGVACNPSRSWRCSVNGAREERK